jgi:hypothetical protein
MVTSLDGLTTAVLLDIDGPGGAPDGLIDQAFRLQHKTPQLRAYDGVATVTFTETALRVDFNDDIGWLFTVEGADRVSTAMLQPYMRVLVTGLSHHWGGKIRASAEEVGTLLLSGGCRSTDTDPSCDSCEAGGPGVGGCAVECGGDSGCSARCGPDSFACCNCPGGCRCCPWKEVARNRPKTANSTLPCHFWRYHQLHLQRGENIFESTHGLGPKQGSETRRSRPRKSDEGPVLAAGEQACRFACWSGRNDNRRC